MGGAKAGEYASQIAVEKITTLLPRAFQHSAQRIARRDFPDVLAELFDQIHRALAFSAAVMRNGGDADHVEPVLVHAGLDVFRPHRRQPDLSSAEAEKKIRQLTHDDTHVGWLLRNGQISEYEARTHPRRNVLQKALGGGNQFVDPQVGAVACERGDIFLLCTDGLVEGLYDEHQLVELCASLSFKKIPIRRNCWWKLP
jgi:PPM family protein phosphatase